MLTEECQGSKTNQIDYVSENTDKRNAAKLDSLHTPHPPALERSPEKVAVSNQIKTGNFLHCDHEFNFWVCFTENFVTFFFQDQVSLKIIDQKDTHIDTALAPEIEQQLKKFS